MNSSDLQIVPNWFLDFPRMRNLFEEEVGVDTEGKFISGLAVSEDDKNVYVEAALPGVDPKEVEVTFDKGVIWVKGEKKEEEKGKKFYRKATRVFSYRLSVPGDVDLEAEPEAVQENGVVKLIFAKTKAVQPKKIAVRAKA